MKIKELLFVILFYCAIGMILGSVFEKYFDDEPYLVFPVDTAYVYQDTLYVDVFRVESDIVNEWKPVNRKYGYIEFIAHGDRTESDTMTITTYYH